MSLDPNSLLLSLLVGSVGFVLFVYGKRQARVPHLLGGIVLCIYPYFVSNLVLSGVIAGVVIGLVWLSVRLGA